MLENKLLTLPENPGCYLMKDKNGTIIYVGKAKNLHKRVNSYFVGVHNNKTTKLVANIADFEYIITPSEKEAFILECNLIKQYRPRFNIMLMDDSSYPYIRITSEKYPVLKLVRDKRRIKNATYFGPYPNVGYARELLALLQQIYPLRKCEKMEPKVCLYYHIGLCLGPCEYEIDEAVYKEMIDSITAFLNGDTKSVVRKITDERDKYVKNLEFEKAQQSQKLLDAISNVTARQIMQSQKNGYLNDDIFNYYVEKGYISIVALLYRDGKLLSRHLSVNSLYDDEPEDVFRSYIVQYYSENTLPKNLILPFGIDCEQIEEILQTSIISNSKGDYKKLSDLAYENAKANLRQKWDIIDRESDADDVTERLGELTGSATGRIELFDNSHISGSDAVGAMVVYINGRRDTSQYRTYNVSNGNDDFSNMKEVLYRHLFRVLKNEAVKPDMIIVDGGMQQIDAAKEIIDSLNLDIALFGLAKNDRHQTSVLLDREGNVIDLTEDNDVLNLLTNMQDEVHRFAISTHIKKRSKNMTKSLFDDLPDVGEKRKKILIRKFSSFKKLKEASVEQIQEAVGKITGQKLYDYLHRNEDEES